MLNLRFVAFAVVSSSMLVVAAGCNADISEEPAPKPEIAPETQIVPGGLQSKAVGDGVLESFCAPEPEKAAYYQVQASRVAKWIFGGNNPFDVSVDPSTGRLVGDSKDLGEAGMVPPDVTHPDCQKAITCWTQIHESLYPTCAEEKSKEELDKLAKEDPAAYKLYVSSSKDRARQCPAADSSLSSAGLAKACGIPSDLFRIKTGPSVTAPYEHCVEGLDACWGGPVSGFIHVIDPEKKILGTDPQPADLTAPLAGGTGAVASARWTSTYVPTAAILWPNYWMPGTFPAGYPCSTYGLPAGARTERTIVASGDLRKCL